MKLTTMTQVTVDGVMQGNGPMDVDGGTDSSAAAGPWGARLFRDSGLDIALDLVDSRADSKGVTIQVYRPGGRPQYPTDRST